MSCDNLGGHHLPLLPLQPQWFRLRPSPVVARYSFCYFPRRRPRQVDKSLSEQVKDGGGGGGGGSGREAWRKKMTKEKERTGTALETDPSLSWGGGCSILMKSEDACWTLNAEARKLTKKRRGQRGQTIGVCLCECVWV